MPRLCHFCLFRYINFMEKKEKDLRKHAEERQPQKKNLMFTQWILQKRVSIYLYIVYVHYSRIISSNKSFIWMDMMIRWSLFCDNLCSAFLSRVLDLWTQKLSFPFALNWTSSKKKICFCAIFSTVSYLYKKKFLITKLYIIEMYMLHNEMKIDCRDYQLFEIT